MLRHFLSLVTLAPDAPALIENGANISRRKLLDRSEAMARQLTASGLRPRDAVAVQLPNSVDFVAAFLAALELDLIVVPIDRDAPETEVAAILGHFAIKGLVHRGGISARTIAERPDVPPTARLIKLTSGTTGKPKGIVTSEQNLIADCTNICATMGIAESDINLGAIPFSHSYGFSNLVMPLLLQGTVVVVTNEYLPQSILELANRHRCTVAPLIPMVFEHLAAIDRADGGFATVKTFISAGAPLPPSTSRAFRDRFGIEIHSFYGCSESGGITYDRRGGAVDRGTVGAAMEGVDVDINRSRVTIRSASVALGYLHDAKTFQRFESGSFESDDLAELRDGEIALTGRSSDLINTAGKKVNPREVEAVILQIEGVREARAYGAPAGARGEVVAAAVVASPDVTREQIRAYCRERLSSHKVPRIVKLIDALPVDERGKVKRAALATL